MQDKVDEMMAQVRRTVAERRANRDYPIGLEAELEAEFDAILGSMHRPELSTVRLGTEVASLRAAVGEVAGTARADSRLPGGSVVHTAVGRVVGRHTNLLAHSVRVVGETSAAALEEVQRVLEANRSADERQLLDVLSGVLDRLAIIDELVSAVQSIERRLDQLESVPLRDQ